MQFSHFAPLCMPNELKTYDHTKTCACMLIEALFIMIKFEYNQDVLPKVSK